MIENQTALKDLSSAAQKFASDLAKKKKKQIENGTYAITVFFETLEGQDDSDGSWFDFTEAVVRGMAKQKSGWVTKVVKRFDYEGRKFKDKDHVVLFGKDVKAEKKKGWTDPKLISEGSNMDIKNIIKSIVEKKLEKDSDDPCWNGYVQLGTKMKDGKKVPNCVPKESVDLDESQNVLIAKYVNKFGGNTYYFEIWKKLPSGNLYHTLSNQHGINISASNIALKGSHDDARKEVQKVVRHYDQSGDKGAIKQLNSLLPGWKKAPLRESVDLDEAFNLEIGTKVAMKDKGKTIYGTIIGKEKVMGEPGVEVKWDSGVKGRFKMSAFAGLSMDRKADYIISETVELEEKATDYASYDDYVAATKKKGLQVLPRKLWNNLKKDAMKESTDLFERVEVDHSRYMRSHSKKARGRGMWMFTSKDMGIPSDDEIVTVSGDLTTAAKEAAKKLGTKRVYVMESVELDEAKTDVYHKHMLKALGKSRLPKNHSFTSAIADNGDFIVRDGGGRVVGRIPKGEHDLKESTEQLDELSPRTLKSYAKEAAQELDREEEDYPKSRMSDKKVSNRLTGYDRASKRLKKNEETDLTEDVHNDLNDAIIEFQRKLMRMTRQLDPAIAKEVKKIDKDLDDLRSGPLFKIRPGR